MLRDKYVVDMGLDEISYVEIEISYVEILLLQIEYICKAYDMNNITHILNIFFLSLHGIRAILRDPLEENVERNKSCQKK